MNLSGVRVGMFLDQSFPPDSRVENEAHSLIEAGHEVHLFSLDYEKRALQYEVINGIHVHRYPAGKLIYKLSALAYTVSFFHRLISERISQFIKEVAPDVLHVHDMLLAEAVMDVNDKLQNSKELILDLHENRPEIMQFYPHLKKVPGKYLINIQKWREKQDELIGRAHKVILVTEEAIAVAMDTTGEPRGKFVSVPNTIKKDIYFKYAIDDDIMNKYEGAFGILYLGDTGIRRGTDTAIRAIKLLIEKVPNAHLIMVGKSTEDVKLRELTQDLGLQAHVSFEGWQDVSLFPSYVRASDVCISPLHRNLHHDTTYANKIFQYMAGGRPLVVSDCPSQANVVSKTDCGLIFEAGNAQMLADRLHQLYKNSTEAVRMGENGLRAVEEQYHWQVTSRALINLYGELERQVS